MKHDGICSLKYHRDLLGLSYLSVAGCEKEEDETRTTVKVIGNVNFTNLLSINRAIPLIVHNFFNNCERDNKLDLKTMKRREDRPSLVASSSVLVKFNFHRSGLKIKLSYDNFMCVLLL